MNLTYAIFGEVLLLNWVEIALILIGCFFALITFVFLIDWATSHPTDEAPRDITEDQK